jgi:hypothetical protein
MPLFIEGNSIMKKSQWLRMAPFLLLCGCSTLMTGEDALPILGPKLIGRHASDLLAMYGQPDLVRVEQGHDVYYWSRLHTYVYTPQYTATTQGTVGNTPFSSTTTMPGETQAGAVPCMLVAGTRIGSDIIERIDVRGMACEMFLPGR